MEATTEALPSERPTESGDIPTVNDFLDEMGHLPSYEETNELISTLLKAIYDEDEIGFWFTDVKLTWIAHSRHRIQDVRHTDRGQEVRLSPPIGYHSFWHPRGAPVPALAFKMKYGDDQPEWWTEIIHPRLVAAGDSELNEHIANWIFYGIRDSLEGSLDTKLKKLQALREAGRLSWTWPQCFSVEPGDGWDADATDRLPSVGEEERSPTVNDCYNADA